MQVPRIRITGEHVPEIKIKQILDEIKIFQHAENSTGIKVTKNNTGIKILQRKEEPAQTIKITKRSENPVNQNPIDESISHRSTTTKRDEPTDLYLSTYQRIMENGHNITKDEAQEIIRLFKEQTSINLLCPAPDVAGMNSSLSTVANMIEQGKFPKEIKHMLIGHGVGSSLAKPKPTWQIAAYPFDPKDDLNIFEYIRKHVPKGEIVLVNSYETGTPANLINETLRPGIGLQGNLSLCQVGVESLNGEKIGPAKLVRSGDDFICGHYSASEGAVYYPNESIKTPRIISKTTKSNKYRELFENCTREKARQAEELFFRETDGTLQLHCPTTWNLAMPTEGFENGLEFLIRWYNEGTLKKLKDYNIKHVVIGHGVGQSTKGTWKFFDTGENVFDYISRTIPKGERAIVACCETGTPPPNAPRGIGSSCIVNYVYPDNPAKIVESGRNEIIGCFNNPKEHNAGVYMYNQLDYYM